MLLDVNGISIRTIALEINPELLERLNLCFSSVDSNDDFAFDGSVVYERDEIETLQGKIYRRLPMVHFLSILVFEDEHHDPLLVVEINFDGDPKALWRAMDDCLREPLRKILQCTKRPRSGLREMYDLVLFSDSSKSIAPYLEATANIPLTPYRGARGMTRQRILNEQSLYEDIQLLLKDGKDYSDINPENLYRQISDTVSLSHQSTLAEARREPEPWNDKVAVDFFYLFLAVFFVAWSIPVLFGLPVLVTLLVTNAVALDFVYFLSLTIPLSLVFIFKGPSEDLTEFPIDQRIKNIDFLPNIFLKNYVGKRILLCLIILLVTIVITIVCSTLLFFVLFVPSVLLGGLSITGIEFHFLSSIYPENIIGNILKTMIFVFPSSLLGVAVIWIWLRFREVSDSTHDGAKVDKSAQDKMEKRENYAMHNHMGSLLIVKPGILRYILNRVNHWLLRSLARTFFRNGELGSMRTIHFAHWALIENGNRLLFLSNFDGTWESYLDDFTVKASKGVNLAWSQCIGFPFGRFLIFGGSERGALFKNWARHSMTETRFWFSAYPGLTVEMIHRNSRVTNGLSRVALKDDKEYVSWARDL